jgi:LuxR family maltose regulon positive regulatory protein
MDGDSGRRHSDRTGDLDVDLLALLNRGVAAAWLGDLRMAKVDLQSALQLAIVQRRDAAEVHCLGHLAGIAAMEGDLTQVRTHANSAVNRATGRGWRQTSRAAYVYTWLAADAYERLDSEQAPHFARLAVELMPERTDASIELFTLTLHAAAVFAGADDPHEVVAALRRHRFRLQGREFARPLVAYTAPVEVRMSLRVGEHGWAAEVLERVDTLLAPCGEQALIRAILQAHNGRIRSARRLLAPLLDDQVAAVVAHTTVDAWLLEAQLADHADDYQRSYDAMSRALAIAEPQGMLRPFFDGGPRARALLAKDTGRFGRLEGFAETVVDALPASGVGPLDGLTNRELTLLHELPSMRTTGEIADALYVSVNTVKTHLRGIYRKLGVGHRRDAITVARELGLQ